MPMSREVGNYSGKQDGSVLTELLPFMESLDALLNQAIKCEDSATKKEQWSKGFRGLYLNISDVEKILDGEPCSRNSFSAISTSTYPFDNTHLNRTRIGQLADIFSLCKFEIDTLLLALAPEIDLGYERLYAYLQDDITKKRPTINLALNLFCKTSEEKISFRKYFQPGSSLIEHGIIHLGHTDSDRSNIFLDNNISLDEQIISQILGEVSPDSRIQAISSIKKPVCGFDKLFLRQDMKSKLIKLANDATDKGDTLRVYFAGQENLGQIESAEAIAMELGKNLIIVNQLLSKRDQLDVVGLMDIVTREALLKKHVLFMPLQITDDSMFLCKQVLKRLFDSRVDVILTSEKNWAYFNQIVLDKPIDISIIKFSEPDYFERKAIWQYHLQNYDLKVDQESLNRVASHFRLSPKQIESGVVMAVSQLKFNRLAQPEIQNKPRVEESLTLDDLISVARSQSAQDLASMAKKITPVYQWNDLILPAETKQQLMEICQQAVHREHVMREWGFGRKISHGKGITVAFVGLSGTGKTMAAEVISNELGYDLFKIDLSGVVSKYVGETEKNLDKIFTAAEKANAILFFDEADALFGKRTEVHDAHDRYANIETSYLLQKMEEYEGLTILATNLQQNLDQAFIRRISYTAHFPFPDQKHRLMIWQGIWPDETPLNDDLSLDKLAEHFKLNGGNIKNIAIAAASIAAATGGSVSMPHLVHATKREYQKMGKNLSEKELALCTN